MVFAGGLGATMLAGCSVLGPIVHEERVMSVAHVNGTALSILTANGSILGEREARGDVLIEVDLYGPDSERLRFANVHADRQGDGSLRIWVEWPGGKRRGNEGASIDVFIPDAVGVDASSSNGNITLLGLAGPATLESSNGNITVIGHSGSVNADTSNGKIRLDGVDGDIIADSSNGTVTIDDAFGLVQVDTSNANVFVSTAHSNPGPVRVSTSNGNVTLHLGDGFEGVLRVRTSNGSIGAQGFTGSTMVKTSKNHLEVKVGSSDEISAVRTSNGNVRISGRDDD
ncbi:MAG: hypothetical protein JKY96_07010 [Phycisphaerales bacterium]|nr:hypothetical protein [Phycisphaerales bacterium]